VFVAKRPSDVRVAVTGAGPTACSGVAAFEEALKKRFSPNGAAMAPVDTRPRA